MAHSHAPSHAHGDDDHDAAEIVAVEIVRTLVGSIGLVLAVPVTTGPQRRPPRGLGRVRTGRGSVVTAR